MALLLIVATVLAWLRCSGMVDKSLCDFPRVQIVALSVLVLLLIGISYQGQWYEGLLILLLLITTIYQLVRILPFTPLLHISSKAGYKQ